MCIMYQRKVNQLMKDSKQSGPCCSTGNVLDTANACRGSIAHVSLFQGKVISASVQNIVSLRKYEACTDKFSNLSLLCHLFILLLVRVNAKCTKIIPLHLQVRRRASIDTDLKTNKQKLLTKTEKIFHTPNEVQV